jgi:hypothetical protein
MTPAKISEKAVQVANTSCIIAARPDYTPTTVLFTGYKGKGVY